MCKCRTTTLRLLPMAHDICAFRQVFLRQSLVVCLLLYGCERKIIIDMGMIGDGEIAGLPSRLVRKAFNRDSKADCLSQT